MPTLGRDNYLFKHCPRFVLHVSREMKLSLATLSLVAEALLMGCGGTSTSEPPTSEPPTSGPPTSPSHTVDLLWTASTSPDVSGYNVYRAVYASSCGSFSKINSALILSTLYTDSEVVNGSAYCYAATAVDTRDIESAFSNIVSDIQIPES